MSRVCPGGRGAGRPLGAPVEELVMSSFVRWSLVLMVAAVVWLVTAAGAWGQEPACTITGTARHDELTGTGGHDVICGLGGDDRIAGGSGNAVLRGGAGDDRLMAGAGADVMEGGDGIDVVDYRSRTAAVVVS